MKPFIAFLFRKKEQIILLFTFFAFSLGAVGQRIITGTVKDEAGTALPGVSITVKGDTTIGTTTNMSGNYALNLPGKAEALLFSSIGYLNKEVLINNRTSVNIVLTIDKMNLNEVVITGYTTQQKKDITGAVAIVDMKSIKSIPAGSAMQALQGQAAGVNVVSSGVPGASSTILIRGISSFGNTQPLVLVDGVEMDLNQISADDIESIQVLKDAGAASIYGVRGSNGVIIVTTKKGKSGVPTLSYHGYYGYQLPQLRDNPLNVLQSQDYARLFQIAFPNSTLFKNGMPDFIYGGAGGRGTGMTGDPQVDPSKYVLDPANPSNNYIIQKVNKTGTDWYHAFFKPAPMTSNNLTASGGTDKSKYLFSLEYLNQKGVVIETYLKRYSVRINTDFKLPGNIRVGENAFLFTRQMSAFNNQADFAQMAELYQTIPIIPLHDIKGNFGGTFGGPDLGSRFNPVASQKSTINDRYNLWDITGNIYAEVDFLKNFTLHTSFGGIINNNYNQVFNFTPYWLPNDFKNPNSYSESSSYNTSSTWTNTLSYSNLFGKHNLKVIAGSEAIRNYGRGVGGSSQNFFSTDFDYLILNNGTSNATNFSNAYINTLFSLFSRLDYGYNDKYLLTATIRRDGSSRFGPKKRYGIFPSFSAGWRLNKESFMQNITWLNDFKIRGSYGVLGSQNNVSPTNSFSLFGGGFGTGYYDIAGGGNSIRQGFFQTTIGNPTTGWEQDLVSNVGFDATIMNRLNFSFDLYKKSVKGLLFSQPLPATTGGAAAPIINIGDIQNTGVDIAMKYLGNINRKIHFTISTNVTSYNNKVVKIPGPGYFDAASQQQLGTMIRNQERHAVSSFFGYKVIGLFSSADDVSKSPAQSGAAPGRFKYKDVDGDGSITTADRTFIGNPNPDFTYSLNLQLEYKSFDLSAFFYGSEGNQIINALKVNSHFFSTYLSGKSNDLLKAWTTENMNTTIPKIESTNSFSTAGAMNSFFVEDGSYLRLKSLILGYSIKPERMKKFRLSKFRIYLQATNLFTITNYSGLDPELQGPNSGFGIDWGNYPGNFKNFIVGIDISF